MVDYTATREYSPTHGYFRLLSVSNLASCRVQIRIRLASSREKIFHCPCLSSRFNFFQPSVHRTNCDSGQRRIHDDKQRSFRAIGGNAHAQSSKKKDHECEEGSFQLVSSVRGRPKASNLGRDDDESSVRTKGNAKSHRSARSLYVNTMYDI